MYWIHVIIVSLFLHSIDGNVIRRRRQQASGSLYGNQNQAGNVPSGYNYPSNTNLYGANSNNQVSKEFYGNSGIPSNTNLYGTNLNNQVPKDFYGNAGIPPNTGNSVNNMGVINQQQQQQQQQQLYGANGQPSYGGTGLYSGSGTNQVLRDTNVNMGMRDSNGNLLPSGSAGSSLYPSSNSQIGYPANTNQVLTNKDMYNIPSNTNNQYAINSNPYPNSNTYNGQMSSNSNTNLWANNQPNSNAYNPNRQSNTNTNNPNSPYFYNNDAHRMMTSCLIIFCSFIAISFFNI